MRFSVRSNCVAHGKTKHNKLVTPVVIDITRGDDDVNFEVYLTDTLDDDDGEVLVVRKPETLHSSSAVAMNRTAVVKVNN